jgi:carbonic anhydrase/acetyltransferase-like protein (isoleucine patch superfamily)
VTILSFGGVTPRIAPGVFIAVGAVIVGDVTIGEGSSIWFNSVLRGDIAPIEIGRRCNIQDNVTIHADVGYPTVLADDVSVGHGAILHGATVEQRALLGTGSIVLNGSSIGQGSVIAAGAVLPPGTVVPPLSLVVGVPGKVVRQLSESEGPTEGAARAQRYVQLASKYRTGERTF